jgi:hypothetical protein
LILLAFPGRRLSDDAQAAETRPAAPSPEPLALELAAIRPRRADAASGSEFAARTAGLESAERQRAAVAEILAGNVPDFLRRLRPVRLAGPDPSVETVEAIVWVTPDYLSIGSGQDFLTVPLTLPSATAVATALGCVLPTTRIVDAVYRQSGFRFVPDPLPPGPKMRSTEYVLRHRALVERRRAGVPLGELVAGHKKDVVLTERLALRPDRVAIYGWHRSADDPIQPLNTWHGERYADYSHAVRLVWAEVRVGGERRSIYDVLGDSALARLLSDEGEIPSAWRIMHADVNGPSSRRLRTAAGSTAATAPGLESGP